MRILIVTPAGPASRKGNRITANRWAGILRDLGHRVTVATTHKPGPFDLLVALHANKSAGSVVRFKKRRPAAKVVVALTGTDVYGDLTRSGPAVAAVESADQLVVLQPLARLQLHGAHRRKARVIYQSVVPVQKSGTRRRSGFRVVVAGHLRPVKDPFRAAMAIRSLPATSRIEVVHFGAALSNAMRRRALAEQRLNPRYRWRGDQPRTTVLRAMGDADLCVLTSRSEGGANVVGEAIVMGAPVVSSRIAGSVGLLGVRYAGYFPVGDTKALRQLLLRVETDPDLRSSLATQCRSLRPLFHPDRERQAWRSLLLELK